MEPHGHGSVVVQERNGSFTQDIVAGTHAVIADEPASVGGDDLGMTPYDLLAACIARRVHLDDFANACQAKTN